METEKNSQRFKEILAVIYKHHIARGVSPEKIRMILEDLGPTYIKLGQIMSLRSDVLTKEICEELEHLRSEVPPMPYEDVADVILESLGKPVDELFENFEKTPIGSASIAQAHKATLKNGQTIVLKVQRKGIYEVMSSDISFLKSIIKKMPPINMAGLVDMSEILEEMWKVAQEEMNFLIEADNLEEFARLNRSEERVTCPKLYREYTTQKTLAMEFIAGDSPIDKETLVKKGVDLNDLGSAIADNYVKQIVEDGFFHADPHPGNMKIRDGNIVWIDMGMMGRFNAHDQAQLNKAIEGVAVNDVSSVVEAILALATFKDTPDQKQLYGDISNWLAKYSNADFGSMNMGKVMQDIMDIMKKNQVSLPHSLTMLVRGLTTIEGILADMAPEINLMDVVTRRIKISKIMNFSLKDQLIADGRDIYQAVHKGIKIPGYLADMLRSYNSGHTHMNLDLHSTDDLSELLSFVTKSIVMGLLIAALLISSSIICLTNMAPQILGIPALGFIGYVLAFVLAIVTFIHHLKK